MLRHHLIDQICCLVLAITLVLTWGLMEASSLGLVGSASTIGYENRLFDQAKVHTIDIVMDDWEGFLQTCTDEQYVACDVVIDGEHYRNVGIRAKGNTSLSSVRQYGNNRYSFKIEFDHYQNGKTYHGLDKLSLNNLIQDKTYLKDYLAYTLMNRMDTASPLCSFVQINVNSEPWGLYLAVEAVEDSFLLRNFGADHGELYKPDSMSFGGGGPGHGKDFSMDELRERFNTSSEEAENSEAAFPFAPFDGDFMPPDMDGFNPDAMPDMNGFDFGAMPDMANFSPDSVPATENRQNSREPSKGRGEFSGGMGSSDVRLQYSDDDPASYENIFNNAKTDITEADQQRLIASLKKLSEGTDIESVVDMEAVIRYFAVHNFMCNDDSYTGMMVHNYYLYEEDGVLSMLPWDYNLSLGGFGMGGFGGNSGATSTVNSPIDSPVSGGGIESRPMVAWIFQSETYTALYHRIYDEFISTVFESGWFMQELERVGTLIAPYVQNDQNGFFSYEEFKTGIAALKEFCGLRTESIRGQLDGTIPSTSAGQQADEAALLDASHINLSDMGEFGMGGGGQNFPGMPGRNGKLDADPLEGKSSRTEETEMKLSSEASNAFAPPSEATAKNATTQISAQEMIPFSPQNPKEEPFSHKTAYTENSNGNKNDLLLLTLTAAGLLVAIIFASRWKNGRS